MQIHKKACGGGSLTCAGITILILAAQLPFIIDKMIEDGLDDELVVKGFDDSNYDDWLTNECDDCPAEYYVVTAWNMTNLDDVLAGAKPNIVEVGPYAYRLYKRKIDVEFGTDGDWSFEEGEYARYVPYRFVHFDREESLRRGMPEDGDPTTDLICTVDKIYAGAVAISPIAEQALFITGQRYFYGQDNHPLVSVENLMFQRPEPYIWNYTSEDDARTNNKLHALHTGLHHRDLLRRQIVFKNVKQVTTWMQPNAAPDDPTQLEFVSGSDGSQFQGGLSSGDLLDVWEKDIIRTIYLYNEGATSTFRGIKLRDFDVVASTYQSCEIYPPNCKYAMHIDGLINLTAIALGMPLFASQAHMYAVEPEIRDTVVGQNPDKDLHTSYINVEPFSGISMNAAKVAQVQIRVGPTDCGLCGYDDLIDGSFLPVFWYVEGGDINKKKADDFKEGVIFGQDFTHVFSIVGPIFGSIFLAAGLWICGHYHSEVYSRRDGYGALDNENWRQRLVNNA